jgi:galactokinase
MKELINSIKDTFFQQFDGEPVMVKSPGRVNLIGEHTDYNEGFVMPAAINKSIILAVAPNGTNECALFSVDKQEAYRGDISGAITKSGKGWPDYLLGVVDQLQKHGHTIGGFDCVFGGNVPIGAGLSSSAALEGGILFALAEIFGLDIPPMEMARIAQKAENEFVGVQCGIMDQFVSLNGKKDYALKLDCRSLEYEYYPFDRKDVHIVLCDTGIRRELASSEYNVRRSQCEQGVKTLQEYNPKVNSLRDVELGLLMSHEQDMDSTVFKRCKYVVEENKRVLQACTDLENNDLRSLGQRMFQSHVGLRYEYEVSCKELDTLVDIAWNMEGVFGCRMMGGGFGGCTINLVKDEYLDNFISQIKSQYAEEIGDKIDIYKTKVSGGTHLLKQKDLTAT